MLEVKCDRIKVSSWMLIIFYRIFPLCRKNVAKFMNKTTQHVICVEIDPETIKSALGLGTKVSVF